MRKMFILMALLLNIQLVGAVSTQEMIESAPVLQVLLDNSGSSPATNEEFVASAWPVIEGQLRAMPMGTVIIVNSVGDASLAPLQKRTRIQKTASAEGAPIDDIIRGLKSIVLGFPTKTKGAEHGQSHLIGGLFDASRNINSRASQPNVIFMLSDLVEYSPLANCYRNRSCPLPTPTFSLENTSVTVLGVGRGLPSNHEMAVFSAWDKFLKTANASSITLKKTF